jgi:hypothetical protein
VRAFELRKRGATYREIAQELQVDVHTIYGDIQAELADLREATIGEATQLRALELERLDGMTSGLWPHVRTGSAPAVTAAVKVSERRARLLGLDAPVASRTEVSGSLSVEAQARYKAEAEELRWLDLDELEELADQSQKMIDDAIARSRARRNGILAAGTSSTDSDIDVDPLASADQPAESGDL